MSGEFQRRVMSAARPFDLHFRAEGGQILEALPAVVKGDTFLRFEAAGGVHARRATATAVDIDPQVRGGDQCIGTFSRIGGLEGSPRHKRQLVHLCSSRGHHPRLDD